MLGMDTEQIMAVYGKGILSGVHPDDRDTAKESAKRMAEGEAMSECYRILSGSGAYIPVRFSGKCTRGVHGETYFNLYYTDASV